MRNGTKETGAQLPATRNIAVIAMIYACRNRVSSGTIELKVRFETCMRRQLTRKTSEELDVIDFDPAVIRSARGK